MVEVPMNANSLARVQVVEVQVEVDQVEVDQVGEARFVPQLVQVTDDKLEVGHSLMVAWVAEALVVIRLFLSGYSVLISMEEVEEETTLTLSLVEVVVEPAGTVKLI